MASPQHVTKVLLVQHYHGDHAGKSAHRAQCACGWYSRDYFEPIDGAKLASSAAFVHRMVPDVPPK